MSVVWIYVDQKRQFPWCVLRRAIPGGRVATLCIGGNGFDGAAPYGPLLVSTEYPAGMACPACDREIGAGTTGAAVAVEQAPYDDLAISREATADLRGPSRLAVEASGEWA